MEHCSVVRTLQGNFSALGLPFFISKPLSLEIDKWLTNSGPRWTVERLKSLKLDLIRQKAGQTPLTWVKKNRNGGWFGVFGSLFRYASKSESCFARSVSALMAYSSYRPSKPDEKHKQSFLSSVGAPDVSSPGTLLQSVAQTTKNCLGKLLPGPTKNLVTFVGSPSVRSPIWQGKSVPQDDFLELERSWLMDLNHRLFLNRHYPCYRPVLEGLDRLKAYGALSGFTLSMFSEDAEDLGPFQMIYSKIPSMRPAFEPSVVHGGKVVPLTKDGGWKVRWIASPYRIHQLALAPLGSALYDALRTLPFDCTFEQQRGHAVIQECLRKKQTVFAVDLSSATDFFPLDLQISTIKSVLDHPLVDLFAELSRSTWLSPYGPVRWTKGQPMGLYPSFASFALTHGMLLLTLGGDPSKFFVLGDDVVILDKDLYERYLHTLEVLGCPYNPNKSVISSEVTEFAGKLITANSVIPQYKWRDMSDDNFLDMVRNYGQRFSRKLTPRQNSVYQKVKSLLPPYGCNHSDGDSKPLEEVVFATETFLSDLPLRKPRRLTTSFLNFLTKVLKPWRGTSLYHALVTEWCKEQALTLDERVTEAFSNSVLKHPDFHRDALTDVLEVSGCPDLPALVSSSWADRPTLLQWYEAVLGLNES